MIEFVIPAPAQVSVPVVGVAERFPVRRIYCVGRNYTAHIREMGGNEREPPFFFQKPTDAIVQDGATVAYPTETSDFQHEIELVLAIGRGGKDIPVAEARKYVYGVAVGIDLTRRDLQLKARDTGRPWESGKAFDASAPIGAIVPLNGSPLPASGRIALTVNGAIKQEGNLADLIWSADEIISQLSLLYELQPGDLIYTGTPAGVAKLQAGDRVQGFIDDLPTLSIAIA
jgi:fumarylpyruvate hydrolase